LIEFAGGTDVPNRDAKSIEDLLEITFVSPNVLAFKLLFQRDKSIQISLGRCTNFLESLRNINAFIQDRKIKFIDRVDIPHGNAKIHEHFLN
jgi:hypothetical protein